MEKLEGVNANSYIYVCLDDFYAFRKNKSVDGKLYLRCQKSECNVRVVFEPNENKILNRSGIHNHVIDPLLKKKLN